MTRATRGSSTTTWCSPTLRRALLAVVLLTAAGSGPGTAQQDGLPSVDEVVARVEKRSGATGLARIGWRIFARFGHRHYMQEMGLELLGRFSRGTPGDASDPPGVRTLITQLTCADATSDKRAPGPNHYVVIWSPDSVAVGPILLLIEAPPVQASFPYLLYRSKKGEPGHAEVDPLAVPSVNDNLFFVNEPILQFQLSPRIMFGHEPGLRVAGKQKLNGRECVVLESLREPAPAVAAAIPEKWSNLVRLRKRFLVDLATGDIEGMEIDISRSVARLAGGPLRTVYRSTVKERFEAGRAKGLPRLVEMEGRQNDERRDGPPSVVVRVVEIQDDEFR